MVSRQIAEELAKSDEKQAKASTPVLGEGRNEPTAGVPDDVPEHTQKVSTATKNTGSRTEKEVSRDKWLAARAAEGRVKDATKKAKDRLRKGQRNRRMMFVNEPGSPVHAGSVEEAEPAKAETSAAKPREPLYESDEVKNGAEGLAERLKSLGERPNPAEKHAALLKVLSGGRDNYFTSNPSDVLSDLKERGMVDEALATALHGLLKEPPAKGTGVPEAEQLAHAQKMSNIERKDDQPFKEAEHMYLKWIDKKDLQNAEAELDAAEAKLEELIHYVEVCYPLGGEQEESGEPAKVVDGSQVDIDYADKLQRQHEPKSESHGSKNTSALSEKVVSSEKWLAARGEEGRDREKVKIAREARRGEARDKKMEAANVDE